VYTPRETPRAHFGTHCAHLPTPCAHLPTPCAHLPTPCAHLPTPCACTQLTWDTGHEFWSQTFVSASAFMTGVAKLCDPRAEFATAWPLEGQIQCDLRDRQQQPMLLLCCPQSETWYMKKMCKVFVVQMQLAV